MERVPAGVRNAILVPVDFSDITPVLVEESVAFARAFQAPLRLVHVVPPRLGVYVPRDADDPEHDLGVYARKELDALTDPLEAALETPVTSGILQGDAAGCIVRERRRIDARMIIMGSHGHGSLHHLLMGNVSEGVVREARCPVIMIPSRGYLDT